MAVNFDKTVLASGQGAFGVTMTVTPVASQPNASSFAARGIWKNEPVVVETRAGLISTNTPTISVRLSEFAVAPKQHDVFNINDPSLPPIVATINWTVTDVSADGFGAALLKLKGNPTS